jgi:DNA-binding transcriptional LysR family regulator
MDRFQAMETFVRVVDSGSFSAAARDLRVGQPAISKLIASLENSLQVRLLVRSTRRLTTTEAGQVYYDHARRAIEEATQAEIQAKGSAGAMEGRLRVAAPVTFARLHVAPRLGDFLDAHPRLQLELIMDDRQVDLIEENIDVALRVGPQSDSALTARKLATTNAFVLAAPAYLDRHGAPRTPADLLAHHAIVHGQFAKSAEWRFRRGTALTSVSVPSRLAFSAAEGVREGVLAGLGLALGSGWMFGAELLKGSVVPLLEDWTSAPVELWAIYPSGRLPSNRARSFISWFKDTLDTPAQGEPRPESAD